MMTIIAFAKQIARGLAENSGQPSREIAWLC